MDTLGRGYCDGPFGQVSECRLRRYRRRAAAVFMAGFWVSMKIAYFFLLGLFSFTAYADEAHVSETSVATNHFRLLTFKCTPDKQDGPESTPQSPPLDVDDPGTPGCNQWE